MRAIASAADAAAAGCLDTYTICRRHLGHAQRTCTPPGSEETRRICAAAALLQEDLMRRLRTLPHDPGAYEVQFMETMQRAGAAFVMLYEHKTTE